MTSTAVKILLLASLGGNAGLALNLWMPRSSRVEPSPAALRIVARSNGSAAISTPYAIRPPAASDADRALMLEAAARYGRMPALGDPRELAERMYREGYPPDVITSVVSPVFGEWMGSEALKRAAREGSASARQFKDAIQKADGPMVRYMADLFPGMRASLTSDKERELRFGALSQDKVAAIERLEEELKWGLNNGLPSPWDGPKTEAKMNESLSRILTPEELADYWRFNSTVARHLQNLIRTITIDEATYDRLLTAATAHQKTVGGRAMFEPFELQHLRGILSDADIAQLISNSGMSNDVVIMDKIYVAGGLSEMQRVEFHALAAKIAPGNRPGGSREAAQALLVQIRASLVGSPEAAAGFETSWLAKELKRTGDRK